MIVSNFPHSSRIAYDVYDLLIISIPIISKNKIIYRRQTTFPHYLPTPVTRNIFVPVISLSSPFWFVSPEGSVSSPVRLGSHSYTQLIPSS